MLTIIITTRPGRSYAQVRILRCSR